MRVCTVLPFSLNMPGIFMSTVVGYTYGYDRAQTTRFYQSCTLTWIDSGMSISAPYHLSASSCHQDTWAFVWKQEGFKPLCRWRIEQRTLAFPWIPDILVLVRHRTEPELIIHLYYHEGMQRETEMYISDSSFSQHIEINYFLELLVTRHALSKNWRCVSGQKHLKILENSNMQNLIDKTCMQLWICSNPQICGLLFCGVGIALAHIMSQSWATSPCAAPTVSCISAHPGGAVHASFQYLQRRWQDLVVNSRAQTWSSPVLPISTFIARLALGYNMDLHGVYNFILFFLAYIHLFWSRHHISGENRVIHCCDKPANAFLQIQGIYFTRR